jgi:predicted AlkP superfamily pyrophosphatase or phosphodiesterase
MNLLTGWGDGQLVRDFAQHSSIAQWSQSSGVQAFTIGPPEYSDSGFTELNNAGSIYIPAKTLSERFQAARKSLKGSGKSITYLYVPELDKAAHATGCESTAWLYLLEELDQEVEQLVSGLDNSAAVVLTADHGVVDVESSAHIYLDEITSVAMRHASGDPRATFIYLEEYQDVQLAIQTFSEHLGANAYVASAAEVVDKGWFGPDVSERSLALMPDIFLLAKTKCAFYHRDYCKPQALRMIGQHGSISSTELKVPLLTWGSIC